MQSTSMTDAVRRLVADVVLPNVERWDRDDVLPAEVLEHLGRLGVPGALVPARYGGRELGGSAMVDVWRTLAQGWISLTGAVNTTALATELLVRYGTEEQRARWLPGIATGEVWSSFSITEPGAGSDLRRIETWVEPAEEGLLVTGRKRWIAGGFSFPGVHAGHRQGAAAAVVHSAARRRAGDRDVDGRAAGQAWLSRGRVRRVAFRRPPRPRGGDPRRAR